MPPFHAAKYEHGKPLDTSICRYFYGLMGNRHRMLQGILESTPVSKSGYRMSDP